MAELKRCFGQGNAIYEHYHDHEWGIPVFDDHKLFEMLVLEGAQAGLNWLTILKRRQGYCQAFHNFNVQKVAMMTDDQLQALRSDQRIIRNRLKIFSARNNARVFIEIQQQYGSFANYLWDFVDGKPIVNRYQDITQVPTTTPLSDTISKDLKRRGMSFVGSTIIYAYMQAIGLVDDHLQWCFRANLL